MRVVAVVNPVAGACRQHSAMRTMLARLRAMGLRVSIEATTCAGDGARLAREAARTADYVIAGGGDGTIREVVEGLSGTQVPLMVWPTGTENLVAKSLGFRAEVDLIPHCITSGRTVRTDVGLANGRCFLVVAGMGFDAEVVDRLTRRRQGHITHLTYAEPIWRTFWTHRFPEMRIIQAGKTWWQGRGMVFVGNMPRYSLGLPVVRDARSDDGLLDVLVLPCTNHVQLLAHAAWTVVGRHVEHGSACYTRCENLRVESAVSVPLELDGDCSGEIPVDFSIRPGALLVRMPAG